MMKVSDFRNKRVTIMGLGLHGGGKGVTKFFYKQGAKVLVTDLRSKRELKESLQKLKGVDKRIEVGRLGYVLGRHRTEDFINTDLVIKNPGVPNNSPYLKIAKKHGVPIETDVGIFFELCQAPIIGVTGTKGKSTVANLIYQFLKEKYPKVVLAGNIGKSALESLAKISQKSKVVLELSSWQLEGLRSHKKSPKTAIITNIYPDHLNRYKNLNDYISAKKIIFEFQKTNDMAIFNYDNLYTRRLAKSVKSKVRFFSQKSIFKKGAFLKDNKIFFGDEKRPICSLDELKLKGEHNLSNILAAVLAAKLLKVPSKNIKKVLKSIKGLAGRQELIRTVRGVRYFNDTTATMPQATIAAIRSLNCQFPKAKIILIVGGQDKKLNYRDLAKEILGKVSQVVFLPGRATKKIKKELSHFKEPKLSFCSSMKEAVKRASQIARKGDIVLLSPAAASFNLFKNEFDRGKQFNKAVEHL